MPDKITIHWTGGGYFPNHVDKEQYHYMIDSSGSVHKGNHEDTSNDVIKGSAYAAHTGQFNTGNIGVAMCGMFDATPTDFGKYPLLNIQYNRCAKLVVELMRKYNIPVEQVFIHAAIYPMFGRGLSSKWDVTVIPTEDGLKKVDWKTAQDYFRSNIGYFFLKPEAPTGWSSNYYKLPEGAEELDDLIVDKGMHWHIANIFKACYRMGRKSSVDPMYDINKILWFAQKHKELLEKRNE